MKAVLVLDEMPENCRECQLNYDSGISCTGLDNDAPIKRYEGDMWGKERPQWCPLKEMPNKKEAVRDKAYSVEDYRVGYNDCLKEIER